MERCINFRIDNIEAFEKDLKENKLVEISSDNIWYLGYNTEPFAEYRQPNNFPNCCANHKKYYTQLIDKQKKFPYCCEEHKKLLSQNWFNKELYEHIPNKVLKQISYTENFIKKNIETDDWYKEITNYIDYTIESFGTPPVGANDYFYYIENWIKHAKAADISFPDWKRKQITAYYDKKISSMNSKTDPKELHDIFTRWGKSFPDLPYFTNIRSQLINKFPLNLMLGDSEYNRFSGMTSYKIRTKEEFIELLTKITKNLLAAINTPQLLKDNAISDTEKLKIDLINANHSIKQNALLIEYSNGEIEYINIILKWLENEKTYMNEITTYIKNISTFPIDLD